ncbi:MAG: bifunctional 4-hydroxy-2-oxoglutarate aldolase/2-dehydro-3-deoxy-phosphogluconate aldolase [Bacilli bacterium]
MTTETEVVRQIKQSRIIAILRKVPLEQALTLVAALIDGGMRAVEITLDGKDALGIIARIREDYGDRVLIGAGTVMTREQLESALGAGADVLFSPHLDEDLVRLAIANGKLMIPGVMTPTEIVRARQAGAQVVKLFPARALGPGYIKDVSGPLPDVSFIPTGGISPSNAGEYLQAGAIAVGMGGSLVSPGDVEPGGAESLRVRIGKLMASVAAAAPRRRQ